MKTHLTKVSLALLSAAFLLGCQDQGSEPVGPDVVVLPFEPQFDKKGTPGDDCLGDGVRDPKGHCHGDEVPSGDATFTATFSVDLTGGGTLFGPGGGKEVLQSGFQVDIPLVFNEAPFFLETPLDGYTEIEGKNCFADGASDGILQIGKKTPNSAEASVQYFFTAWDKTRTTRVTYHLKLSGDLIPEQWVPALVDQETTINGSGTRTTFEVKNNNSPAGLACKGTGTVNFTVVVKRIS